MIQKVTEKIQNEHVLEEGRELNFVKDIIFINRTEANSAHERCSFYVVSIAVVGSPGQ